MWQVQLEPVPLQLEPPTAQEFHADLQQLFSTGPACSAAKGCRLCLPHARLGTPL